MNKILGVVVALALALTPSLVSAGGASVCDIGVSTPTTATVLCATGQSTLYGVEFSSAPSQVAGNVPAWADIYDSAVTTGIILGSGTIDTKKIMTGVLDTNKSSTAGITRNAANGIAVTHSNSAVPLRVIYSTP